MHAGAATPVIFPPMQSKTSPPRRCREKNPIKLAGAALKITAGINAAQKRLREIDPAIVAGFGGYPSFPALWAARARKIPILIFQADAVLGRVNRYFAPAAAAIGCGFDRLDKLDPKLAPRKVVTGIPIRGRRRRRARAALSAAFC